MSVTNVPTLIGDQDSTAAQHLYTLHGTTLCLDTFLTPQVLDWLTAAFLDQTLWEHCLSRITPYGRAGIGVQLNSFGVLQACLMTTPPFLSCKDNHLWDLRFPPAQTVRCQDWERLVESLAQALFDYLARPHAYNSAGKRLTLRSQTALRHLRYAASVFEALRNRRTLPPSPTRYPSQKCVNDALQVLEQVVEALAPEDYQRAEGIKRDNQQLITKMVIAFTQHGPKYHRRQYPKGALIHAIAEMLAHLEIEQDQPATIANRIAQRLKRL